MKLTPNSENTKLPPGVVCRDMFGFVLVVLNVTVDVGVGVTVVEGTNFIY